MSVQTLRIMAVLTILVPEMPTTAAWKAGNADVTAAAADARIAETLAAMNEIDRATVSGDQVAFAGLLADDLAVNNPQNSVSVRGATRQQHRRPD